MRDGYQDGYDGLAPEFPQDDWYMQDYRDGVWDKGIDSSFIVSVAHFLLFFSTLGIGNLILSAVLKRR